MARGTCLRFLSAAALFAAEAVVGMTLLAVAPQPVGAQLFDDRFPFQSRRQRGPWDWFEPAPQQPRRRRGGILGFLFGDDDDASQPAPPPPPRQQAPSPYPQ